MLGEPRALRRWVVGAGERSILSIVSIVSKFPKARSCHDAVEAPLFRAPADAAGEGGLRERMTRVRLTERNRQVGRHGLRPSESLTATLMIILWTAMAVRSGSAQGS